MRTGQAGCRDGPMAALCDEIHHSVGGESGPSPMRDVANRGGAPRSSSLRVISGCPRPSPSDLVSRSGTPRTRPASACRRRSRTRAGRRSRRASFRPHPTVLAQIPRWPIDLWCVADAVVRVTSVRGPPSMPASASRRNPASAMPSPIAPMTLTVRRCGYPDLLATGELCRGEPLHDRQHPHDTFMGGATQVSARGSPSRGQHGYVGSLERGDACGHRLIPCAKSPL